MSARDVKPEVRVAQTAAFFDVDGTLLTVQSGALYVGYLRRHGLMRRSARIRVLREGVDVYEGQLASLKRFKEDVREVRDGLECGLSVENFNDIKVGDTIQAFTVVEVARTLETAGASKDS